MRKFNDCLQVLSFQYKNINIHVQIATTLFLIRQLHSRCVSLGLYCLMITDEALYPINHAWRVHWAADSSGLMRPSIIDARFNDESASESIAGQRRAAVNTHLIRDVIFHDDFRLFVKSKARRVPDFSQASPIISIAITRRRAFYTRRVSNSPLSQRLIPMNYQGQQIWSLRYNVVARNNTVTSRNVFLYRHLSNKCLHAKVSVRNFRV